MRTNFRGRLLGTTLLIGVAAAVNPALAQDVPANVAVDATGANQQESQNDEEIVVTGSRIATSSLNSPSPIQVITSDAIQRSGVVNVQEVLLENPAFGTPTISRTNSNFSTSSAGIATVDLRNLGTARTLVLVNGRRFVSGLPGGSAVDLNVIPTQLIERVDVLTGGASAVYGSDAVAGVVNIIYKTDFQGLEANAQYGVAEEGDDIRRQVNLTFGTNFSEGRGNITVFAGYSDEGAVFSRNRAISRVDQASTGATVTGDPAEFFDITRPFYSSFAPQGRFFANGATIGTFDANNNFITGFNTNGSATRAADGYNRSAIRTIAIPTERYVFSANARYEVTEGVEAFLETNYAKTRTRTELEPFAIDSVDILPATGGYFNVENFDDNGVLFTNPFVPAAMLARLTDSNGDGLRDVAFTRRLSDVANRGNVANRDTFRVLGGLRGTIFDDLRWEVFYGYGQTTESQVGTGQVNIVNFRNALQVSRDAAGNLVCLDQQARADGCVPVNVFGRNTISADALRYIDAPSFLSTDTSQKLAGANIGGELFDLWGAGPLGVAVGVEYRKERSSSQFDALQQAGLNGGNAIPSTFGDFDVKEAYAEAKLPILTDTFIHELSVNGAARISDYSTVGSVWSWNGGVDFAPVEDIRFTAIWARSTRAPNINELYSPPSQTFPTGLQDPCEGVTATTGGTLGTQCRADPGVAANIAANGAFTLNQADQQGISGFDRGNPLLSEEQGNSFTARVIINPRSIDALRNFSLTANYFNIRVQSAIVSTPRQFILDQCYAQGNSAFCDFVTRRATIEGANSAGSLDLIDSAVTNSGGLKTSGLDFTLGYNQDLASWGLGGRLTLTGSYTHLLEGYVTPLPGSARDYFAGESGAAKDRFFASATYSLDRFNITFRGTYIGESYLDDQFLQQFTDLSIPVNVDDDPDNDVFLERESKFGRISPEFYLDTQIRYNVNDTFEFYFGADNVLGNKPPVIPSNLPFNTTGAETDAGTYDAIGRRFYFGGTLRF
jgi:iron complex outermembrane receptor protein